MKESNKVSNVAMLVSDWTEIQPGMLQSMGLQRVRHDLGTEKKKTETKIQTHTVLPQFKKKITYF